MIIDFCCMNMDKFLILKLMLDVKWDLCYYNDNLNNYEKML